MASDANGGDGDAAAASSLFINPFEWAHGQAKRVVDYVFDDVVVAKVWPVVKKVAALLSRPEELAPLMQMAIAAKRAKALPQDPDLAFCYDMLNRVSRSFAVVIQQLPLRLRDPVCMFYLVLRALDTVEDDMAVPADVKIPLLRNFYEKCYDKEWTMECGTGHYVRLMQQYPRVVSVFLQLEPQYQKVIVDITRRMGEGMAEFIPKEVVTIADYEKYCHYVAGLVGVGLSDLWAASCLEGPEFAGEEVLSNHMGLFLQKTNIIRDYLEDIAEEPAPRMFWPREIWGRHAKELADLKEPKNAPAAVACLNEMVTDALKHVPHCLAYMERVQNWHIFRFCAIPQVMAAGTLGLCYANPKVFTGVVKMRRGLTAKYMVDLVSMREVYEIFEFWAREIDAKCQRVQRSSKLVVAEAARATAAEAAAIRKLCAAGLSHCPPRPRAAWKIVAKWYFNALALALIAFLVSQLLALDVFQAGPPQVALLERIWQQAVEDES